MFYVYNTSDFIITTLFLIWVLYLYDEIMIDLKNRLNFYDDSSFIGCNIE